MTPYQIALLVYALVTLLYGTLLGGLLNTDLGRAGLAAARVHLGKPAQADAPLVLLLTGLWFAASWPLHLVRVLLGRPPWGVDP